MLITNQRELCSLLLFFGVLYLSVATETCYAQGKPDEIKALLKERRELLSDAETEMTKLFRLGRITLEELTQADRDSLKADLDWFERPKDRIKAIEKHRNVADMILKTAEVRYKSARATQRVVLQARAYVVELQIELLKEKRTAKSGN